MGENCVPNDFSVRDVCSKENKKTIRGVHTEVKDGDDAASRYL